MSVRSITYWLVSCIVAAIAVSAAEPASELALQFTLPASYASSVLPVPEPGRAVLLFAGILAMAFTYRRAWLSWKNAAKA